MVSGLTVYAPQKLGNPTSATAWQFDPGPSRALVEQLVDLRPGSVIHLGEYDADRLSVLGRLNRIRRP